MAHSLHNLKVLYDAGIPIAMGTDNMLESMTGEVEHKELAYMWKPGLLPCKTIVLVTRNGAEHLGSRNQGASEGRYGADRMLEKIQQKTSPTSVHRKIFQKGNLVFHRKRFILCLA